jgi:hypothetical protein
VFLGIYDAEFLVITIVNVPEKNVCKPDVNKNSENDGVDTSRIRRALKGIVCFDVFLGIYDAEFLVITIVNVPEKNVCKPDVNKNSENDGVDTSRIRRALKGIVCFDVFLGIYDAEFLVITIVNVPEKNVCKPDVNKNSENNGVDTSRIRRALKGIVCFDVFLGIYDAEFLVITIVNVPEKNVCKPDVNKNSENNGVDTSRIRRALKAVNDVCISFTQNRRDDAYDTLSDTAIEKKAAAAIACTQNRRDDTYDTLSDTDIEKKSGSSNSVYAKPT